MFTAFIWTLPQAVMLFAILINKAPLHDQLIEYCLGHCLGCVGRFPELERNASLNILALCRFADGVLCFSKYTTFLGARVLVFTLCNLNVTHEEQQTVETGIT